jgi:release factor glutamine methyltransferase
MTTSQAQSWATTQLTSKKISTARLDADVLLSSIIKKSREHLYAHSEQVLTSAQEKAFQKLITRRVHFEPIAYLTGHKEFYGRDFAVTKHTLIPRPETELLIETVVNYVRKNKLDKSLIADIGTGSGCVAIILKKQLPTATIIATDISAQALITAKKNAKLHKADVVFKIGNLLAPIAKKNIGILIANLPYVPSTDKKITTTLNRSLQFEPARALYSGTDGLNAYRKLFAQISRLKKLPKAIFIEFDPRQKNELRKLIRAHLPQATIEFKKDLAGKNRVAVIRF